MSSGRPCSLTQPIYMPCVVTISITIAAFEAIKSTLPDDAEAFPPSLTSAAESGSSWIAVPEGQTPTPAHAVRLRPWMGQVMATFPRDASNRITGNALFFARL